MTYNEQIAAIVAEISPILKAGFDPETYAIGMLEEADEDEVHFEVRGLHTKTGNPYTFWIEA